MDQILTFLTEHWILSSLFLLLLLAFFVNEAITRIRSNGVSPEQAIDLINHQQAHVIDIRSSAAFASGHILGANHMPASDLEKKLGSLQKYKDKPIIVVCAMGNDAVKTASSLKEKGYNALVLK